MKTDLEKNALALYKGPFKYQHGYIFDSKGEMVSDDHNDGIVQRIRGWGRIQKLPDAEALQDQVGHQMAALTEYWEKHNVS